MNGECRLAWSRDQICQKALKMRLPRLRFTVRGQMVAVAIAGMALFAYRGLDVPSWPARLNQRSKNLASQARGHASKGRYFSQLARQAEDAASQDRRTAARQRQTTATRYFTYWADRKRKEAANLRRVAAYHTRMTRNYQWSAAYPWIPFFTDRAPPDVYLPADPSAPIPPPADAVLPDP
jgi:hypothetical protein